jgi:hypothetical protein
MAGVLRKNKDGKESEKLNWTDWLSPISWFAHRTETGKKYVAPVIEVGDDAVQSVVTAMNEPYRATLGKIMPSPVDDAYNWVREKAVPHDMLGAALLVVPGVGAAGKMIKVENAMQVAAAKRVDRGVEALLAAQSLMSEEPVVIEEDPDEPVVIMEDPDSSELILVEAPTPKPTPKQTPKPAPKPTPMSADPDAQIAAPGRMELKAPQAQEDAGRYDIKEITISDPSTLPILMGVALSAVVIAYVYNS